MSKKDISLQISGLALKLEDFRYTIEHRTGTRMQHVDALSRYSSPEVLLIEKEDETVATRITKCQEQDGVLKELKEQILSGLTKGFTFEDGILCKEVEQESMILVPEQMQDEVIRKCHDQGHFAAAKTEQLVRRDYWFAVMTEKMKYVVQNCLSCILAEQKYGKPEGFLNPLNKGNAPLGTYHICRSFVWLYPTKTTCSAEVISKLLRQSAVFGNPRRIISDQGSAFTSSEFKEYCKNERIEHSTIVSGVPRGNGQA